MPQNTEELVCRLDQEIDNVSRYLDEQNSMCVDPNPNPVCAEPEPEKKPQKKEKKPAKQKYYVFSYQNATYQLTPKEYKSFCKDMMKKLRTGPGREVREKARSAVTLWKHFNKLNNDQYVVSWLIEATSGADLPNKSVISNASKASKSAYNACKGTDLATATKLLQKAEPIVNKAINQMRAYRAKMISGGGNWITGLEITKTTCFTIAAVAGGAALMTAGYGVVAAGAMSSGGTALVESASYETGRWAAGDEQQTVQEALTNILANGAKGALLGAAGAKLARMLSPRVVNGLYAQLGPKIFGKMEEAAAKKIIAEVIEGSASNTFSTAINESVSVATGKTTWKKCVQNIVTAMIAGGIGGKLAAHASVP